jgi:hypothetical protein
MPCALGAALDLDRKERIQHRFSLFATGDDDEDFLYINNDEAGKKVNWRTGKEPKNARVSCKLRITLFLKPRERSFSRPYA